MGAKENYKTFTSKIIDGEDQKGKFTKYRLQSERPCNCHPETCSHQNGTIRINKTYNEYEDGSKEYF